MEGKIMKSLQDLGYNGPGLENNAFTEAINQGPKNANYTVMVNFLTNELRALCCIDEQVNAITTPEDHVVFQMELSSFLKELGCSHDVLTRGHISDRLNTVEDRLLLLEYLITELMAARMLAEKTPGKRIDLKIQETPQAENLRKLLMTLHFPKPPANITIEQLFSKLIPTVETAIKKGGNALLGHPILNATLSGKQWDVLNKVQKEMHSEYTIRREMLLTRLDCTIQSFQWSDRMKGKEELINKSYGEKRKTMKAEPGVSLADLISAREDLAIIEKTSNASVRKNTKSSINKVIIGQVPDRGGRTSEQAPPPPEMPSWQQRSAGPPSGRGGGRGGNQRGGNHQRGRGNYNNQGGSNYNQDSGYNANQNSGNYNQGNNYNHDNRSNYNQGGGSYSSGGDYSRSVDYNSGVNRGGATYRGKYGGGGTVNNGGSNYSNQSFDSAGSYNSSYGGNSGNNSNKQQDYSDNRSYDSAGSYGSNRTDYREAKRAKTFDNFQSNKTTYADQYVQESEQNQQYRPRNNNSGRGRGRSNYQRGGGSHR